MEQIKPTYYRSYYQRKFIFSSFVAFDFSAFNDFIIEYVDFQVSMKLLCRKEITDFKIVQHNVIAYCPSVSGR